MPAVALRCRDGRRALAGKPAEGSSRSHWSRRLAPVFRNCQAPLLKDHAQPTTGSPSLLPPCHPERVSRSPEERRGRISHRRHCLLMRQLLPRTVILSAAKDLAALEPDPPLHGGGTRILSPCLVSIHAPFRDKCSISEY